MCRQILWPCSERFKSSQGGPCEFRIIERTRTSTRRKKKTRVSRKLSPLTHDGHHLALRINEQGSDGPSCSWLATRIRPNNLIAASAKQLGGQLLTIVTVVFYREFEPIATVHGPIHAPTTQHHRGSGHSPSAGAGNVHERQTTVCGRVGIGRETSQHGRSVVG
jgi:hypothetical protein